MEHAFKSVEFGFTALDGVPDTLPRDAGIFGYLGERKVVIIICGKQIALAFRQERPVIIKEYPV